MSSEAIKERGKRNEKTMIGNITSIDDFPYFKTTLIFCIVRGAGGDQHKLGKKKQKKGCCMVLRFLCPYILTIFMYPKYI